MSRTRRSLVVLAAAAVGVTTAASAGLVSIARPASAAGADPYASGSTGWDISWPQCGGGYPSGSRVAVVGVGDGMAFTHNGCLASEARWAGSALTLYVNLNSPTSSTASHGSSGPAGTCASVAAACQAYNYGYAAADDAVAYAGSVGLHSPVWWLDIEGPASSSNPLWSSSTATNAEVITGALDALAAAGLQPGIYSTPYQWNAIAGSFHPAVPSWQAGAPASNPSSYCASSKAFTAGPVWLAQAAPPVTFDADVACPSAAAPPPAVIGPPGGATTTTMADPPTTTTTRPPTTTTTTRPPPTTTTTTVANSGVRSARLAGADREQTAILASQSEFPTAHTARSVVIARSDDFPDALAGVPLAVATGGPLLLSDPTGLSTSVSAEISRATAGHATAYILGGTAALPDGVAGQLSAIGLSVVRVAGQDRYATAVAVAQQLGNPHVVLLATGATFADALAGGAAAALAHGALLLTQGTTLGSATSSYLNAHRPSGVFALGGPAASADQGAVALVGPDRYATATDVASRFAPVAAGVSVAAGTNFPDALAGGVQAAMNAWPLLLAAPSGLTSASTAWLAAHPQVHSAVLVGGTGSLPSSVESQLARINP